MKEVNVDCSLLRRDGWRNSRTADSRRIGGRRTGQQPGSRLLVEFNAMKHIVRAVVVYYYSSHSSTYSNNNNRSFHYGHYGHTVHIMWFHKGRLLHAA